jgi:hypothetical protein
VRTHAVQRIVTRHGCAAAAQVELGRTSLGHSCKMPMSNDVQPCKVSSRPPLIGAMAAFLRLQPQHFQTLDYPPKR